ncbi:hypothetical protein SNE40_003295 [Patella caerulea]|uniref:DZF domain-containing protein n=1 Tax=Patella caerulea TaxID=87958 RepID=A0AAN8KAD5_PATCE
MAHFVYPMANTAQPASGYPTAQTAYVAAPQAAYATAPRAGQAYETAYQAAHATPQYAYTTRTPVAVTPAVAYDQTKAYYQPGQAVAAYTTPETHYQAAKPSYSTSSSYNATAIRQQAAAKPQSVQVSTASGSYVYPASTSQATTSYSGASSYNNANTSYDAALYTAATSYYQQQQTAKTTSNWALKKQSQSKFTKAKGPPKQPQLHYCDVCKISCAGPQTYREHLEGQKHKKKESAAKAGSAPSSTRSHNQLRCELCDVTCTGTDAYAAHIRGTKHQKVLKLHTRLGKPIPSNDPVVITSNSSSTVAAKTAITTSQPTKTVVGKVVSSATQGTKKVLATPKITFVGGTQLKTTGVKTEEIKVDNKPEVGDTSSSKPMEEELNILGEKEVSPVGHEYIEEMKNDLGKVVSFNCKLCECKFNDPNAKEMHLKGRRHRLQYKKKVDPNLQVEVKPSIRARKVQEDRLHRPSFKDEFWRRREQEERWRGEMEEDMYWQRHYEMEFHGRRPGMMPPRPFMPGPGMGMGMPLRRPDSSDDRRVMAKHATVYPTEVELQAVQNMVTTCEKALKQVSDLLAESDAPKPDVGTVKKEKDGKEDKEKDSQTDEAQSHRTLKGVMRVGVLAKGLLLHGDLKVNLVVLCSEKPTRTLLERVADGLSKHLAAIPENKFEVKRCVEEAAIIVTSEEDPKTTCIITLSSPVMRETNPTNGDNTPAVKDPPDVLDKNKCLEALAALRHAKWFQARANGLPSCVIVIRIMRDLCQRVPTWTPLSEWALELLVEKCISSGGQVLSPGDGLRRVFECIASGILLPGGPGLCDPCEKEPTDAAGSLTNQQREEITASAQHALRLIAFRQIHKVLGMDPAPLPKFTKQRFNPRKRRRTNSAGGEVDDAAGEKKDKKDGDEAMETVAEVK